MLTPGENYYKAKFLREKYPCYTLQQIGDKLGGISRERVRQLLEKSTSETVHFTQKYKCLTCGNEIKRSENPPPKFCSRKCRKKFHQVTLICDFCGKEFDRYQSSILLYPGRIKQNRKFNNFFCSKQCHGKWLAKNYGFKKGWNKT